ncbi:TonB-dependent receptor [Paraglaciecola sp. 20A4]|uniref:TonB-dependent receptor n=1 Tax=Paraglaciecola sp. 20A4 TaxID=2687288 RepID=UPI001409AEEE|nr:TonB-dependent receptor [Paraglaciecola sp. 20A4]
MNLPRKKNLITISILSGLALYAPFYASAESPEAVKPSLEVITVTAQKRLQTLGETPLSIQAFNGDVMDSLNIVEMQDLTSRLTNVNFSNSSGPSFITIRGLGTGSNTSAEQSVGMFVDGIYVSRGYQFNAPFLDIERVEVLKGPQGILAGKNSVAGAVVIHSRRPTDDTEGYFRASYDFENEGHALEGAISGALTDTVFARLTAMNNFEGGWIDTNSRIASDGVTMLEGDNNQNTNKVQALRLGLVWEATDDLSFFGKLETSKRRTEGTHFGVVGVQDGVDGQTALATFSFLDPNFGYISDGVASNAYGIRYDEDSNTFDISNEEQYIAIEAQSATLQFDWELGDIGTLTGISGYSTFESEEFISQAMSPIEWLTFEGDKGAGGDQLDQYTQEIRLVSPGDETIDYVVGLFYMDRTIEQNGYRQNFRLSSLGYPAFADFSSERTYKEQTTSLSGFAQITWNITDTLRANVGARYTDETKERLKHSIQPTFIVNIPPANQAMLDVFGIVPFTTEDIDQNKVDEKSVDPSVSLQWDIDSNNMLYASLTSATKAGGFNSTSNKLDGSIFDSETSDSFEVGLKSFLMDGRVNINVAVFHSKFDDLQVSALDPNTNTLTFLNAAKATSEGIETDLRFAATDYLEIGGAIAYLNAVYDDYPGASCSAGESIEADCDPITFTRNAAGDSLRFSPEVTGNLYADYRWSLDNGMQMALRGDITYSGEYFFTSQNDPYGVQDSFAKANLMLEIKSEDDSWLVSIVGKNLTDKISSNFGGATPLVTGAYWANSSKPRQIFINAQYNFF